MKDRYIFPAFFEKVEGNVHVEFPDLPGVRTFGKNQEEALFLARELLALSLLVDEKERDPIPEPSSIFDIKVKPFQVIVLVDVYLPFYSESFSSKPIFNEYLQLRKKFFSQYGPGED